MDREPTYGKLFLRIIFVLVPTIFCSVVCVSSKFTHSLDKWIFPCGLYLAFMALIALINVILYAVAACINTREYW